jgi:hypothetical protein
VRAGSVRDHRGGAVSLYLPLPGLPTPDQQRILLGDRCPRKGVPLTGIEPRRLQRTADSGRVNTRLVCPECGSWICGLPRDGVVRVRGGTLDDTSWLRPTRHIWPGGSSLGSCSLRAMKSSRDSLPDTTGTIHDPSRTVFQATKAGALYAIVVFSSALSRHHSRLASRPAPG